jgi:5-methylcytosine-specific restriction endonuclease McrA
MSAMPDACPHTNCRIVWTRYSSYGEEFVSRQLRHQCLECGRILTSSLKHSLATPDTPEISREEAMRYHRKRLDELAQAQRERELSNEQWRARYDAYIGSDAWAVRREQVISRAGGICEGCREAEAVQAHHLSYRNMGNEFLWELVAICRNCHERVHGIEAS